MNALRKYLELEIEDTDCDEIKENFQNLLAELDELEANGDIVSKLSDDMDRLRQVELVLANNSISDCALFGLLHDLSPRLNSLVKDMYSNRTKIVEIMDKLLIAEKSAYELWSKLSE